MSIETIIRCDALHCTNEREIEDSDEFYINAAGWHEDPHDDIGTHYCPRCWPIVKKELEDE